MNTPSSQPGSTTAYDSMPCAVWVRDASGLTYANLAAARLFGFDAPGDFRRTADTLGWSLCDEHGNPLPRSEFPSILAFSSGRQQHQRMIGIEGPGRPIQWVLIDCQPIVAGDGHVQQVVSTAVDVTELKQAEIELRTSQERYRRILETTHEGLCLVGLDSTIRFVNDRLCDMLGYKAHELLGCPAGTVFGRVARGLLSKRAPTARREVPLRRRDGTTVWATVAAMPYVEQAGDLPGLLVMFNDVTGQEEPAASSERIEQLVGDAIYTARERIAMDLHDGAIQSLYGVALSLGALRRRRVDETEGAILKRAIDQLTETIHGIRDYIYQLRTGVAEEADLEAALKATADDLARRAGVTPHVSIQTDLRNLSADGAHHMLYIAHEALSNVARHARATDVAVRIVPWRSGMMLSIVDNGRGFDPGHKGRRRGEGLRNMSERAGLLGATLTIDSQPGTGTTVKVQVP